MDRRPAPPARAFPPGPSGVGAADYLDLSAAPDSGPVGGRLQQFTRAWESITSDGWVLATVSLGYSLEFTSTPPSNPVLRPTPVPTEYPKRESLESEIEALLQKRAIRPVPTKSWGRGFTSTFFLTPKKEPGAWRPIINLRPLNRFIRPKKFRMETIKSVIQSLSLPAWASSIDLKDAYLHVPIHPRDFEYLRFFYNGRLFEFTALPFGLSTSPRVFTRIAKTVAAFLRRNGVQIYQYLDDWLIVGGSCREALSNSSDLPTRLSPGLHYQSGEVQPVTFTAPDLPRCGLGPPPRDSLAHTASYRQPHRVHGSPGGGEGGTRTRVAAPSRPYGEHGGSGPLLQTSDEAPPAPPSVIFSPEVGLSRSLRPGYGRCPPLPGLVALPTQSRTRTPLPVAETGSDYNNQCFPPQMGSLLVGPGPALS